MPGNTLDNPSCIRMATWRLVAAFLFAVAGQAGAQGLSENEVKAALVYKIAAYVTWPTDRADSFVLCTLTERPLAGALEALSLREAHGRIIRLRRVSAEGLADSTCDLLYVEDNREFQSVQTGLRDRPVLTVSDHPDFAEAGGMIEMQRIANRFGFRINREAAVEAGLVIAAPLLELATLVRRKDS